jgi:hypothetical protein
MTANCRCSPQKPNGSDSNSISHMERLDRMPPAWRALVHDFGWTIVDAMIADGHRNAANLRQELEAWRERKQEQWLAEIPYLRSRSSSVEM